jgi:hypothetical protein
MRQLYLQYVSLYFVGLFSVIHRRVQMITGSLVALVTPMQVNGDIDWPALKSLVEWHIAEGTHGIVAVGLQANRLL